MNGGNAKVGDDDDDDDDDDDEIEFLDFNPVDIVLVCAVLDVALIVDLPIICQSSMLTKRDNRGPLMLQYYFDLEYGQ